MPEHMIIFGVGLIRLSANVVGVSCLSAKYSMRARATGYPVLTRFQVTDTLTDRQAHQQPIAPAVVLACLLLVCQAGTQLHQHQAGRQADRQVQ